MVRRTYGFTEFFNSGRKLSIQFLTSSLKDVNRRAAQCRKDNKPYTIYNRITNEVVDDYTPQLVQHCVSCEQPSDELEMTSDGLKCWSCIEDPHLNDGV